MSLGAQTYLAGAALDPSGEIIIAPTFAATTSVGDQQVDTGLHILKLHRDGTLAWDLALTDHSEAYVLDSALTATGQLYIAGTFARSIGTDGHIAMSKGDRDAFVAQVSPEGQVNWLQSLGGLAREAAVSLSISEQFQRVAIGGWAESTFAFADKTYSARGTAKDGFSAVYSTQGTPLWAQRFHGLGLDRVDAVAWDQDALVVFGSFATNLRFETLSLKSNGLGDLFCTRFGPDGEELWQRSWGGDKQESADALRIEEDGRLVLAAHSYGDINLGGQPLLARGGSDLLLWTVTSQGEPISSLRLGGSGNEFPTRLTPAGPLQVFGYHDGATNLGFDDILDDAKEHAFALEMDSEFRVSRVSRPKGERTFPTNNPSLELSKRNGSTTLRW